jgi:hypothetical protein
LLFTQVVLQESAEGGAIFELTKIMAWMQASYSAVVIGNQNLYGFGDFETAQSRLILCLL